MTKKIQIFLTILALAFLLVQPLNAIVKKNVDSDQPPSSTVDADEPSSAPESTQSTENLKNRIEKIVEEKTEQIKDTVDDLSKPKQGFIGEIQRVSEEAITINNSKGTKIIALSEEISITKKSKAIDIEDLAIGDWLIIMGYIDDDDFQAKKIIAFSSTLMPDTHIVSIGSIEEISKNQITINPRSGNDSLSLEINKKTNFEDFDGQEASLSDFSTDLQCLIVGFEDEDGKIATTIRSLAALDIEKDNQD